MKRALLGAFAMSRAPLGVALALCLGCSTTVRSGAPPGQIAPGYDQRWRHSFFLGTLAVGETPRLDRLCPGGWSEVQAEVSLLNFLVMSTTAWLLYTPSTLTVVCAADAPDQQDLPRLRLRD